MEANINTGPTNKDDLGIQKTVSNIGVSEVEVNQKLEQTELLEDVEFLVRQHDIPHSHLAALLEDKAA